MHCVIRHGSFIALVVFTGADIKIMLNGEDTPSKRSKTEKETNFNVPVNFGILIVIAAIANGVIDAERATSAFFFQAGSDPTRNNAVNAIVALLCASTF